MVDLGGVAAHFRPDRRLEALADLTGMTTMEIQLLLFDSGLDRAAELGFHTTASISDAVLSALGNSITLDQLVSAWALAFEANHELLHLLNEQLSEHAIHCCLFTNNGPLLDLCLKGPLSEIAKPFARIACSWHVRAAKPTPEAFAYVEAELGATPSELLLIDDDIRNTRAAQAHGWNTHLYSSIDSLRDALRR